MNLPENYIPVLIQAAVGLGFVAFTLIASHFWDPKILQAL
jgi:NADH-quinone oxidoreductase subunit A